MVSNSKQNEAIDNIIKNIQASLSEIFPDARGLSFVLSTTLSKLRSLISLMTHPQDRTKTEHTKTISIFSKSIYPSEIVPRRRPSKEGHNKR